MKYDVSPYLLIIKFSSSYIIKVKETDTIKCIKHFFTQDVPNAIWPLNPC